MTAFESFDLAGEAIKVRKRISPNIRVANNDFLSSFILLFLCAGLIPNFKLIIWFVSCPINYKQNFLFVFLAVISVFAVFAKVVFV